MSLRDMSANTYCKHTRAKDELADKRREHRAHGLPTEDFGAVLHRECVRKEGDDECKL